MGLGTELTNPRAPEGLTYSGGILSYYDLPNCSFLRVQGYPVRPRIVNLNITFSLVLAENQRGICVKTLRTMDMWVSQDKGHSHRSAEN